MPKTAFTKGQLINLHKLLINNKMLPFDKVSVWHDPYHSGKVTYNVIKITKDKEQLDIGFITKTVPKVKALEKQLTIYFGKGGYYK